MDEDRWKKIVARFHLHSLLIKAIKRNSTSASASLRKLHGLVMVEGVNDDDSTASPTKDNDTENLWMHTFMTSSELKNNFAVSSSHFDPRCLSLSVVLGASKDQVDRVEELLNASDGVIGHPYLMLGICAELVLFWLQDNVEATVDECIRTTRKMSTEARNFGDGTELPDWDLINQVRFNRTRSHQVEEEVKTTKRYLSKILPRRAPDDNVIETDLDASISEVNARFYDRFDHILIELEGLVNKSRIYAEEMSFNAETIRGELARRLALSSTKMAFSSARLAEASVIIAVVATFYLPMTSVATVFSMPVFRYENYWRDWRYRPVENNTGEDGNGDSENGSAPVFSGYFWIYLGVAIALTLTTFFTCVTFIQNSGSGGASGERSQPILSSFLHHMTGPIRSGVQFLGSLARTLSLYSRSTQARVEQTSSNTPRDESQVSSGERFSFSYRRRRRSSRNSDGLEMTAQRQPTASGSNIGVTQRTVSGYQPQQTVTSINMNVKDAEIGADNDATMMV
ncbi:hypothetical protein B0I35DRAFT_63030 [Stachybotrys elegans]|uniref:Uncharacterized protein n=1 Tax=Stachybotrys elegans TaxID=80388 RepID=A0A8K0SJE4_9HYPO|nr:hypothetical protein B0I35DRAFT_63030 [Stachybotrys elegans]